MNHIWDMIELIRRRINTRASSTISLNFKFVESTDWFSVVNKKKSRSRGDVYTKYIPVVRERFSRRSEKRYSIRQTRNLKRKRWVASVFSRPWKHSRRVAVDVDDARNNRKSWSFLQDTPCNRMSYPAGIRHPRSRRLPRFFRLDIRKAFQVSQHLFSENSSKMIF